MASDQPDRPDSSGAGDATPPPTAPARPALGDPAGYRNQSALGEQATTLMPVLTTPAQDEATTSSNRKLGWLLAGSLVLVGVLLFSVLGGSTEPPPPLVQTPASNMDTASALPPEPSPIPVVPPPPTTSEPVITASPQITPTTTPPLTTAPLSTAPLTTAPKTTVRTTQPRYTYTPRTTAPRTTAEDPTTRARSRDLGPDSSTRDSRATEDPYLTPDGF